MKILWLLDENCQKPLVMVEKDTILAEAIAQMYQAKSSCILITKKSKLTGIITQTDIMGALVQHSHQMTFADMTVEELMSQPVIAVSEAEVEDLPSIRQRFQQEQISHLPIIDPQGMVLNVITQEDVKTAQLQQEIAQREQMSQLLLQRDAQYHASETRLNDILNSAIATSIVSFRVLPNHDWEYDYQSPGCETLFGYTSQEILHDKNLWMSQVHPQDRETVIMALFADIFAGNNVNIEYRFYHKDGSLRWICATYTSRYDSEGNCWIVTGTSIDISELKQVEAALRQSEERWQLAIAGTDEAIWDWDIRTNHTYRSDRWFEMLGYERQEMNSFVDEWSSRIHPDDYDRVIAAQSAYLRRKISSYYSEYRLCCKDGKYKWFRSRAKAIWDEQGNPIRLVGSLGDITERKTIETALERSAEQYRLLFENNPNPMWIFDSETLRFLAINQAAINQYGYSEAEFLSMTLLDIIPRDEIPAFLRFMSDFDVFSATIYLKEVKHQKRDGTVIDVEINAHFITWEGKRAKFVLAKDITEQTAALQELQKIEAELRESQHFIEQVISHSPQLLYVFDPKTGSNVYLNGQSVDILGYTPEEIKQRGVQFFLDVVHPDDLYLLERNLNFWPNAADGEVLTTEWRMKHKNGSWRWLRSRDVVFARDENNRPSKVLGTSQDITDSKLAEIALHEHETMLRSIGDNLPNGAVYQIVRELDGSDRFTYFSAGIQRLMEVEAEDVIRDAALLYRQLYAEDIPNFVQAVEESYRHLSVFNIQLRVCTPSGLCKWLQLRSTPRQLPDGRVAWDGLLVDITDIKHTEETLRQSESLLSESQQVARLGNWEYDLATDKISWSQGLFYLFQRDPALPPPTYQENLQIYHPDDQQKLHQAVERAIATGESYKLVLRAFKADGSSIYVEGIGQVEFNSAGQVIRLYGTAQDITNSKQAEQTLQEKEQFLSSIYNGVSHPIFVVDVINHDFCFMGLNPAHERFTGLLSSELIGKTPEQVLPPITAASVRQHYQDCVAAGTTITYEEYFYLKDTDTWWITSLTPLKDEKSRIYRIVGSSINITEQKRAQQMLELQAVITRNMAEGLCLVRADDNVIVYANPKFEQIFGYDTGELIGQHISIIHYEDGNTRATEVHEAIAAAVMKYAEATYEIQNIKKDGTPLWCRATTSVFEHPEYGTVFVAVQQDITEQRQTEETVKVSLKEKEVLLKEIHHRVKNNLGIVSSLLQMQCRRTQDHQASAILRDSQNRIASIALVHEKLYRSDDLANIDFAQYIPDLTTHLFDSYNVSSNCIKLIIQVEDASLDIETAIPCGLIINELVSNALKYAFPNNRQGEIKVRLYHKDDYTLMLIVGDNGIGLPAEFDSKKTKTLGLTLVQGLVKQLRGKLEIQSQLGTEFKITLTKNRV